MNKEGLICLAIRVIAFFDPEEIPDVLTSIENAWDDNPHGGGIAYAENGKVVIDKGYFNKDAFKTRVEEIMNKNLNSDILVHLRYASAGEESIENCHPFMIGEDRAFIHNGTITQMKAKLTDKKSDTVLFGEYLSKLPDNFTDYMGYHELINDFLGTSKIAVVNASGESEIFNEHLGDTVASVWYSNDYYKADVTRKPAVSYLTDEQYYRGYGGDGQYWKDYCIDCSGDLITTEEKVCCMCTNCMNKR